MSEKDIMNNKIKTSVIDYQEPILLYLINRQ